MSTAGIVCIIIGIVLSVFVGAFLYKHQENYKEEDYVDYLSDALKKYNK